MKTNLDKLFKTDSTMEKEGVDFALDDKISFRVRRFNNQNPRVKAAMAKHHKPFARQIELGTLSPEKADEIMAKVFVETCLVSWEGVEDEAGKPIECTPENALALFKSMPDLFDALWKHANDFVNYKEDLGNSSSAISAGRGAGAKK